MARASWLKDVVEDLRRQGVPVHYVGGYESRGTTTFDPKGIICHDTGGSANSTDAGEIGVLLRGSATAPAPIAQFYLSRTTGVHLVATGRCNHALTGKAGPLKGLGNTNLIGIEAAANPGRAWPPQQYRWYVLLVAAICRRRGWSPHSNVSAHREHQPGQKVDPQGIDMAAFRRDVAAALGGSTTQIPEGADMPLTTQDLIAVWTHDLVDGPGTGPAYKLINQIVADVAAIKAKPAVDVSALAADPTFIAALADAIAARVNLGGGATPAQVEEIVGRVVDRELDEQSRGGADVDPA